MHKEFVFPKRIGSIQCLRFIAALAVAFSHFLIVSEALDTAFNATFFLRLFFTISGFIVMLSTIEGRKKGFFLRRLIRLVPLYWLLTVMVFIVAQFLPGLIGYKPDWEQLLKSMFFIPFSRLTLKTGVTLRPIVGLGHTLQMEIFFSVIFATAMRISHKYRAVISCAVLFILALVGRLVPFENDFFVFYLNKNYLALFSFCVGILIFCFLRWMQKIKISNRLLVISGGITTAVTLVLTHLAWKYIKISLLVCAIGFLAFFALIVCAAAYSSMGLPVPRLLQKLGDASYSFYLIHYFVVSIAERFLHIDSFSPGNMMLMIVVVTVAWIISYISHYIIEEQFCGLLVKHLNRYLKP